MNTWLTGAGTLAIAVAYAYHTGYVHGTDKTTADWTAEKLALATQQRKKEAELQSNMDKLREAYSNETAKLATNVRNLSNSLRNRPSRPAVPEVASAGDAGRGCTGAELYREDAELVVAESERAEIIRIALKKCQAAYKNALMVGGR